MKCQAGAECGYACHLAVAAQDHIFGDAEPQHDPCACGAGSGLSAQDGEFTGAQSWK